MGSKKLCPILTAIYLQSTAPMTLQEGGGQLVGVKPVLHTFDCVQEKCSWWDDENAGCIIFLLNVACLSFASTFKDCLEKDFMKKQ